MTKSNIKSIQVYIDGQLVLSGQGFINESDKHDEYTELTVINDNTGIQSIGRRGYTINVPYIEN